MMNPWSQRENWPLHDHGKVFTIIKNDCMRNVLVDRSFYNEVGLWQGRRLLEFKGGSMRHDTASKNIVCFKNVNGVVNTKMEGVAYIRYFLQDMCYLLVFPLLFLTIRPDKLSLLTEGCNFCASLVSRCANFSGILVLAFFVGWVTRGRW